MSGGLHERARERGEKGEGGGRMEEWRRDNGEEEGRTGEGEGEEEEEGRKRGRGEREGGREMGEKRDRKTLVCVWGGYSDFCLLPGLGPSPDFKPQNIQQRRTCIKNTQIF